MESDNSSCRCSSHGIGDNMRYVTFGWGHSHCINGKTFDKDCVAIVDSDQNIRAKVLLQILK